MEQVILILDFILIAAAAWTIFAVRGLGGIIGRAFGFMMWGMIFLGLAHILETATFEILNWSIDVVEFLHRLVVLSGFVLLTWGFRQIQRVKQ